MSLRGGHQLLKHAAVTNKAIIRSVFRKHNHTDHLTGLELKNILVDLELPKEILNDDSIEALMLLLDADNSGNVDFTEFFDWWAKMCGDNVEDLDVTIINLGQLYSGMKQFTENVNGTLDFDAFAAMWEYCGNEMEPVNDVFDQLDADGSGTISFSELAQAFGFVGNAPEFDKEHFAALFDDIETLREKQRQYYEEKLNSQVHKPMQLQKFRNKLLDEARTNATIDPNKPKTVPKYERRPSATPVAGGTATPKPQKKKLNLKVPSRDHASQSVEKTEKDVQDEKKPVSSRKSVNIEQETAVDVQKQIKDAEEIQQAALKKIEEGHIIEREKLIAQVQEAQQQKAMEEESKRKLALELEEVKRKLQQLEVEHAKNNNSRSEMEKKYVEQVEKLKKEIEQAKKGTQTNVQDELQKLRTEFDIESLKLTTQLSKAQETIAKQNTEAQEERKKHQEEVTKLKKELEEVKKIPIGDSETAARIQELTDQNDHLKKQFDLIDTERLTLMTTVKELAAARQRAESIAEEYKKKSNENQTELERLQKSISDTSNAVTDRDTAIFERDKALKELEPLKTEHLQLKIEYEKAVSRAESAKVAAEISSKELIEFKAKYEKLSKELTEAKRNIDKLKRENQLSLSRSMNASSFSVGPQSLMGAKWDRRTAPRSYRLTDNDTTIHALHDYDDGAAISTFSLGTAGIYKWEITVESGGGATYVGVVSNQHPKNKSLRTSPHAWALRLEGGVLFENGKQLATSYWSNDIKFEPGCKITVVADMSSGTISFQKDGTDGGVAFQNVPSCVYPAITVYHRGIVSTDFNIL
jgi:hypothetical protein